MANNQEQQVFFLPTPNGQRLCVYHPATGSAARAAVLYIHPFAEEMNKSRRMANLQSRKLAGKGYAVLQIDLHGCGDSSGDFGDATSQSWFEDISVAWDWLIAHSHHSVLLWGLRLGATLALDFSNAQRRRPAGFLLWHPVLNGENYMSQLLRLRVASDMLEGVRGGGVQALRESILREEAVEIAWYRLNPELVHYIDSLRFAELVPKGIPVCWIDVAADKGLALSPLTAQVSEKWRQQNPEMIFDTAIGPAFWATQEISECPDLIDQTVDKLGRLAV